MEIKIVTDYLDRAAERFPDKTAFVDENRKITFKEVRNEAERVAMSLIKGICLKTGRNFYG